MSSKVVDRAGDIAEEREANGLEKNLPVWLAVADELFSRVVYVKIAEGGGQWQQEKRQPRGDHAGLRGDKVTWGREIKKELAQKSPHFQWQ